MSKTKDDTFEQLLRHAQPRPVPGPDELAAAKAAVRSDWRQEVSGRRTRRRFLALATAATVLLGAFVAYNSLLEQAPMPMQLAAIEKSFGPVYFLGEQAELRPTDNLAKVMSGQTMVTGEGAGIALAWGGGGSVRVDANTRVRFASDGTVYLESGRVYFDSLSGLSAALTLPGAPVFELLTPHGTVSHNGTQYMAMVSPDSLVVSVREGEVDVDGQRYDATIASGEQATISARQRPAVLNISRSGEAWAWLEATTPATDVDGKSLHEFLVWVSRELGLELRFEGSAETVAHDAVLRGTIDVAPSEALRLRLATAALRWRIEGGVIYITD